MKNSVVEVASSGGSRDKDEEGRAHRRAKKRTKAQKTFYASKI